MAGEHVLTITDANFSEITRSGVVLVDFWAEWCGPCRMLSPIIAELAETFAGKAKIGKLNVDDNQETAARFGVTGIPTIYIFKNGEVVRNFVGVQSKETLTRELNALL